VQRPLCTHNAHQSGQPYQPRLRSTMREHTCSRYCHSFALPACLFSTRLCCNIVTLCNEVPSHTCSARPLAPVCAHHREPPLQGTLANVLLRSAALAVARASSGTPSWALYARAKVPQCARRSSSPTRVYPLPRCVA
jgi:hypothetical protein